MLEGEALSRKFHIVGISKNFVKFENIFKFGMKEKNTTNLS